MYFTLNKHMLIRRSSRFPIGLVKVDPAKIIGPSSVHPNNPILLLLQCNHIPHSPVALPLLRQT
jgi:hypothetical protein